MVAFGSDERINDALASSIKGVVLVKAGNSSTNVCKRRFHAASSHSFVSAHQKKQLGQHNLDFFAVGRPASCYFSFNSFGLIVPL